MGAHRDPARSRKQMSTATRKDKGRRLQVLLAEKLALAFGLTIRAEKPTRPGVRKNGVVYVAESGGAADLHIRRSGQPGVDVALLSARALDCVALVDLEVPTIQGGQPLRRPIYFECKNTEEWKLEFGFWDRAECKLFTAALLQCEDAIVKDPLYAGWVPVVVAGKNDHPPLAIMHYKAWRYFRFPVKSPVMLCQPWVAMQLDNFIHALGCLEKKQA